MSTARIEQRGARWHVIVQHPNGRTTVVADYTAKWRALDHARMLSATPGSPQNDETPGEAT